MPNKVAMTLAVVSFFTTSGYAFAEHEAEFSFPWEQTQSLRGHKLEGKKAEHWGKHHHHGIYLEGSDYEHYRLLQYD
jgi:hypothetical protein